MACTIFSLIPKVPYIGSVVGTLVCVALEPNNGNYFGNTYFALYPSFLDPTGNFYVDAYAPGNVYFNPAQNHDSKRYCEATSHCSPTNIGYPLAKWHNETTFYFMNVYWPNGVLYSPVPYSSQLGYASSPSGPWPSSFYAPGGTTAVVGVKVFFNDRNIDVYSNFKTFGKYTDYDSVAFNVITTP